MRTQCTFEVFGGGFLMWPRVRSPVELTKFQNSTRENEILASDTKETGVLLGLVVGMSAALRPLSSQAL